MGNEFKRLSVDIGETIFAAGPTVNLKAEAASCGPFLVW
jgi:hypothetical protein